MSIRIATLFSGEKIQDIVWDGVYAVTTHGRIWSYPKQQENRTAKSWKLSGYSIGFAL
jgi:hypothetical protein